ncbi:hypothetical protein SDC9_181323 [bioreactor metagenome]|uniref:Uncharacterized protein n=1 Tax=bioreactor metagenome TaxID=1076179 RepID=A0A645H484_9ZZZZ
MGRVQGGKGVLKHHLGPLGAVDDLPFVVFDDAQHGAGQGGFPAAGLPHQAQCLPLPDGKGDVL